MGKRSGKQARKIRSRSLDQNQGQDEGEVQSPASKPKRKRRAMPATTETNGKSATEALSGKILDAQQRNAAFLARANEILADAAKAIWASEMDLIRLESERASRLFQPVEGRTPQQAAAEYGAQWHDNSEKIIAHAREIGDLSRKCCWQLYDLYIQNIPAGPKNGG